MAVVVISSLGWASYAAAQQTTASITLYWTSPGDDGNIGAAAEYDIRYSLLPINDGNWSQASQASGEPVPSQAGQVQQFTVNGLQQDAVYYVAMKSRDEVFNWSALSNVIAVSTVLVDIGGDGNVPSTFDLSQNYPNPFNPSTNIDCFLPHASHIRISIYNSLGQQVRQLVSASLGAGTHSFQWNGTDTRGFQVASGTYFYSLLADGVRQTRRMTVLR